MSISYLKLQAPHILRVHALKILSLTLLLWIFPFSAAYGLGPLPENATFAPSGGIFGTGKVINDSAADIFLGATLRIVGSIISPPAAILTFGPVAIETMKTVSPRFRVFADSVTNSARDTISTAITPVIEEGFRIAPQRVTETMWDVRQEVENKNGQGWAWGPPVQPITPNDNQVPYDIPYTYRYEQQGPTQQLVGQDESSGVSLRPYTGLQQVPASQETSWGGWNLPDNNYGYPDTIAPAVPSQDEQPAVTAQTGLFDFNGNASNQSMLLELSTNDYGPYDWASQFYSLPFDSGQTRKSDERSSFNTGGGNYDWSF